MYYVVAMLPCNAHTAIFKANLLNSKSKCHFLKYYLLYK